MVLPAGWQLVCLFSNGNAGALIIRPVGDQMALSIIIRSSTTFRLCTTVHQGQYKHVALCSIYVASGYLIYMVAFSNVLLWYRIASADGLVAIAAFAIFILSLSISAGVVTVTAAAVPAAPYR